MPLSRRDLLRSAGAVGGAAALAGFGGLSAEAVAGTAAARHAPLATRGTTLRKGAPGPGGYRPVVQRSGEPMLARANLGINPLRGRKARRTPLLAFAQLSDVHILDAQSPARAESGEAYSSSAYRPQEILTAQIAEAMVLAINEIARGPVTGAPLAFAVQTGDNADNAQFNEIRWNITLLDGGEVRPDSGDHNQFEGVMDSTPLTYFPQYWHPEGTPTGLADDTPRGQFGFPVVPGLLDAARRPFEATGLAVPWITALGNHDQLCQGNFPPADGPAETALGTIKNIEGIKRTVTADPDRRMLNRLEIVEEHFVTTGAPLGHGFTQANRDADTAYYTFDQGAVRFIVLDSVNANGGSEGSLDATQFAWLRDQLDASRHRLVVLASHHTSTTMVNSLAGPGESPRVLGTTVVAEALKHDNVVAWVNGHTHDNNIWPHKRAGGGGFWEINTASHIDWPQQARLIEIADNHDGTLSIFTTMLDHAAPLSNDGNLDTPLQLAALARELAANDWQERDNRRRGHGKDRNTELLVRAPKFLR